LLADVQDCTKAKKNLRGFEGTQLQAHPCCGDRKRLDWLGGPGSSARRIVSGIAKLVSRRCVFEARQKIGHVISPRR
jgi:hypothetical protein